MSNRWIFLRGLTRGNIHWGDFPALFLEKNPEAEVEYLEIPGNGLLSFEITPTDPKILIDLLKNKSHVAQSSDTYHLCGISLGGMLALKWAELYPESIESVSIINSSLSQFSSFNKRLIPANYLSLMGTIFEHDSYLQEEKILKLTSNKSETNEKYLNLYAEFAAKYKVSTTNLFRQLILANNIRLQKFPKIKLKIFSSAQDRLVHSSCSVAIAKELSGRLSIHPTAGHDLPLDEPEWLIEQLLKN